MLGAHHASCRHRRRHPRTISGLPLHDVVDEDSVEEMEQETAEVDPQPLHSESRVKEAHSTMPTVRQSAQRAERVKVKRMTKKVTRTKRRVQRVKR